MIPKRGRRFSEKIMLKLKLHRDQTGADAAALHQHDVVGPHSRGGRHDVEGNLRRAETRAQRLGRDPGLAACAENKEIQFAGSGKNLRQRRCRHRGNCRDRPCPDAVRQAKQRAAMRHAGETEAALFMRIDRRLAREMWIVHWLTDFLKNHRQLA